MLIKKRLLLALLALAGLIFSYYYEPSLDALTSSNKQMAKSDSLNFYLRHLETRTFNLKGQHTNTLKSKNAFQLEGRNQIILEQPKMDIALNMAPWVATAETGTTSANLKKITLSDNVKLSRIDGIADVTTEKLVFDSADEVAYTTSAVKILARGSETTADGVHVDLNREIIQLKNNVRTYYAPDNSRSRGTARQH